MSKTMKRQSEGISFFQRYLTVWVLLCMVAGVLIGHFLPAVPKILGRMQVAGISIPIAVLIWIMIYPMMIKVDFQSIREVGKNPKGLFVTWITNWLIKPFTMYMDYKLVDQAFYHVWSGVPVPVCSVSAFHCTGACDSVSGRGSSSGCGTVHGDGFCMEHTDAWKSRLHCGTGCDQ